MSEIGINVLWAVDLPVEKHQLDCALIMGQRRHSAIEARAKLRDADAFMNAGASVAEICDKLGVSKATYHRWRNNYAEAHSSNATNRLDTENESLRRTVIDLLLQIDALRNGTNGHQ